MKLIKKKEVAEMLAMSPSKLDGLIRNGFFPRGIRHSEHDPLLWDEDVPKSWAIYAGYSERVLPKINKNLLENIEGMAKSYIQSRVAA